MPSKYKPIDPCLLVLSPLDPEWKPPRKIRVPAVAMRYCPDDPVLLRPMYRTPCLFSRAGFRETLAAGYWPDGSLFEYALVYRGKPTLWRVRGCCLEEIDGERTVKAFFPPDQHPRMELM